MNRALFTSLALLSAAPAAVAMPFTVRMLPAGLDTADHSGIFAPSPVPIAADFLGNGRQQWYMGGNVISRFPEAGTITLPAITLPQTPSATVRPLTGAVCDANRDGRMDIVRINEWVGNSYLYTLQVFLNNGSGGFTLGYRLDWTDNPTWAEGGHYFSIVPADYDNAGGVDLAVLEVYEKTDTSTNPDQDRGRLIIRWNDGLGGFATTTTVQSNRLSNGTRISAADFDRDGDTDLYCSLATTWGADPINPFGSKDSFGRSFMFTNLGARNIANVGGLFTDVRPVNMVDVNDDGWADLVGNTGTPGNNLSLNNGDGTFEAPRKGTDDLTEIYAGNIFADMKGDSRPEWIWYGDREIRIGFSVGADGMTGVSLGSPADATLPARIVRLAAADGDGDGDTDLFASLEGGTFAFIENTQLHTFPGAALAGSVGLSGITSLKSGDFDRDSQDDVLAVNPAGEKLWIINTQDSGAPGTVFPKGTASEAPHSAVVADFDHDGWEDVAYTLPSVGTVRLAANSGGAFPGWTDTAIATGLTGVSLLGTGEYGTPDGWPDLYTASGTSGQLRGLYQTAGVWGGQNIFSPVSPLPQAIAVGSHPGGAGDELAYLPMSSINLQVRAAQFTPPWSALGGTGRSETINRGAPAPKIIWGDTNGDTRPEIIYINSTGGLASWVPLLGTSALGYSLIGTSPSPIRDIASVDWDQDGRADVLAVNDAGLCVFHYRRTLNQWVRTELYTPATSGYTALTVLNLNGDHYPDAVALHSSGRLDYITNQPFGMRADLSTSPDSVQVGVGSSVEAVRLPMETNGIPAFNGSPGDGRATVIGCTVEILRAVNSGGTWIPGSQYSGIENVIAGATLEANDGTVCSLRTDSGLSNGLLTLRYLAGSHTLAPVAPGVTLAHSIRLHIAQNAQPGTRFFARVTSVKWVQEGSPIFIPDLGVLPGENTQILNHEPVFVAILSPLEQWRITFFGSALPSSSDSGNNADPDHDGVVNLVEFILGTDPLVPESALNQQHGLSVLPPGTAQSPVQLRLILNRNTDPRVLLKIESSFDLSEWSLYARRSGSSWNFGPGPVATPGDSSVTQTATFTTPYTPAAERHHYFRLSVVEE